MNDMAVLIRQSSDRVVRAKQIAEESRHNEQLHRLAMDTVFALEDCHELIVRIEKENAQREPKPR